MDARKLEKLAVAQALYNVVGAAVSTKNDDNLRAECDRELREAYELLGVKSIDARVNGEKVGTYSVRVKKAVNAQDAVVYSRPALQDVDAFAAWITDIASDRDSARLLVDAILRTCGGDAIAEYFTEHCGELPGGCEMLTVTQPAQQAQPETFAGALLKVDAQKVANALRDELPAYVAGLLSNEV